MRAWWGVFPGADKLDLGPDGPIAFFLIKEHAVKFSAMYGGYATVKAMPFFDSEDEQDFLEEAELIWEE